MAMQTEVQVVTLDQNGNVIDEFGRIQNTLTPRRIVRRLEKEGGCFYLIETKSGGTQFRHADISLYNELAQKAAPLNEIDNVETSTQDDVENFINRSISMKPDSLIISDLKWKYLMRSVVRGKNIMMTGPSGCGKTLAVQSVAKALNGRPYFYFNLGATTDPRSTLIGNTHFSKDKGTFVADALFVQAIQTENAIILMDELTRANPDAWNILITVLDENQRYLRIDERPDTPTIRVANGVTFIATANIGAEYTATRVLDRAMLDRFSAIVEMEPLNMDDESSLIAMKFPNLPVDTITAIAEIANTTRTQVKSDDPKVTTSISSRMTVEMAGLIFDGFSLEDAAEVCIYPFFSDAGGIDSERTFMRQLVQKYTAVEGSAETPWDAVNGSENFDNSMAF
jgi:MoxR-like ATPase